MPFGLTNTPAIFQSYIYYTLYDILDCFCVVYLDDILIFSNNPKSHTSHIKQVLDRLRKAELFVNLKKYSFYQDEVGFLGFVVNRDGVQIDMNYIKSITSWEEPHTYEAL